MRSTSANSRTGSCRHERAFLAAAIDRFGGVDELTLHRLPRRAPGRGHIEVQVEAASINAIDVRRRGGYGRKLLSLLGAARMPLVLGNDFAGIVTAVGRGVSGLRDGDAVFGAMPASSAGSHASHVAVRAEHAALQPAGMAAQALAVPCKRAWNSGWPMPPRHTSTSSSAFRDAPYCGRHKSN